jgi:Fe-S-cluster-containing dehydrogenase component
VSERAFFIDHSRCIGCRACVVACASCETHRGRSMIHLEAMRHPEIVHAAPQVCMHCEDPICAKVCPADAIKATPDGVVQSALAARCIGCSNCVLACPFGVPKYVADLDQMMKCDMCYDRSGAGRKPWCAAVCPSQALAFETPEDIERTRHGQTVREWHFGDECVRTKVYTLAPRETPAVRVDLVRRDAAPGRHARTDSVGDDVAALLGDL